MSTKSTIFFIDLGGTLIHIYEDYDWGWATFISVESTGGHEFITPIHPDAKKSIEAMKKEFRRWTLAAEDILERQKSKSENKS